MSWTKDKVFNNGDDFVKWLDDNYSKYITSGISELHMHHTYKPNHSSTGSTLSLHQGIRNFHVITKGWSDIGEHITIGKDGKIALGRPITIMPASATSHNGSTASHPFMFETIGNFDKGHDVLEGSQLASVLAVCKYFHNAKSKKLKFHNEMSGKTCPGSGIDKVEFVKLVEGGSTYTPPKPQTKPATVDKPSWTEVTGSWTGQTLKQGQYGDPVKQLQTKLANNEPPFYPNKGAENNGIDSYYGADTKDAVRRYQSLNGLKADGMAGEATYAKLGGKTASKPVYKPKSKLPTAVYRANKPYPKGAGVKQVQQALASVYFYPNKGAKNNGIDSVYGSDTANAVKRFQSVNGLKADGVYGPTTRKKLLVKIK